MRFKSRRQPRRLGFWLLLLVGAVILLWLRPARQPINDVIDHLKSLGYRCEHQAQTESVYLCSDQNGGDLKDPQTKTSLWLNSPYKVAEDEVLMGNYCRDENLWELVESGQIPTAWEVDRQIVILPTEFYNQPKMWDQYPARQAWLDANLQVIPTFSLRIDLDTRCKTWYLPGPSGGSLVWGA